MSLRVLLSWWPQSQCFCLFSSLRPFCTKPQRQRVYKKGSWRDGVAFRSLKGLAQSYSAVMSFVCRIRAGASKHHWSDSTTQQCMFRMTSDASSSVDFKIWKTCLKHPPRKSQQKYCAESEIMSIIPLKYQILNKNAIRCEWKRDVQTFAPHSSGTTRMSAKLKLESCR